MRSSIDRKSLPKAKHKELRLLNLRVSEREKQELAAAADEYAGGNLSAWLRMAGRRYRPAQVKITA